MSIIVTGSSRRRSGPDPETYTLPASPTLVTVPTYDGSGKSIHPSMVDMGTKWNGYRWWYSDTPFATSDITLENASIFRTNDRTVMLVPPEVTNPIGPAPTPSPPGYNSDDELVWDPENERLVLFWRGYTGAVIDGGTNVLTIRAATSTNGSNWTIDPDPLLTTSNPTAESWYSPTVFRAGLGDWRMWMFGSSRAMVMWTATNPLGPWTGPTTCTMSPVSSNWHGDIIKHDGTWYGIFSDALLAYPMVSTNDGTSWNVGASIGAIPASYRPTMLPSTEAGYFDVWTSRRAAITVSYYRLPMSLWTDLI